jgi:MinD-like ATPase involved in chromosome partitioning or flagellar assembly
LVSAHEDQAAGLRRLVAARHAQIVAVAGARGAADQSAATVLIARECAAAGSRVVIIDEQAVPEGAAPILGAAVRYDLLQALNGDARPSQVVLHAEEGIRLLPAARFARRTQALDARQQRALAEMMRGVQKGADVILVNAHAPRTFSPVALAAQHGVVVVAAGSSAATEGFRLVRQMCRGAPAMRIALLSLRAEENEYAAARNLQDVLRQRLAVRVELHAAGAGCPVLSLIHALRGNGAAAAGDGGRSLSVAACGRAPLGEPMVY